MSEAPKDRQRRKQSEIDALKHKHYGGATPPPPPGPLTPPKLAGKLKFLCREQSLARFVNNAAALIALRDGDRLPEEEGAGQEDFCAGLPLSDLQAKCCNNALFAGRALGALARMAALYAEGHRWAVLDLDE